MVTTMKLKSLADVLFSREMKIVYHWILGIAVALTAIVQTNFFPFQVAFVGMMWFGIAHILSQNRVYFRISERDRWDRKTYFSNTDEYWAVLGVSVVAIVASSFVYVPFPFVPHHIVDKGNGEVLYGGNELVTRFNPFVDTVRNYRSEQGKLADGRTGLPLTCRGKTADGKGVQASVRADLTLPFEGLRAAYVASNNQGVLTIMVMGELCVRFADAVGRYTLMQMPTYLALESNTAEEKHGMNKMGVRYSGLIQIGGMHAYVAQDH